MPPKDFPAGDEHVDKPVLVTDTHQSVTPASFHNSARVPWRPLGAATVSVGSPIGIGVLHPMLGEVIAIIEIVVVLTIIATALFGTRTLSERAFRLLRWLSNRPEPPTPGT
jgi:hypothetical protein